MSYKERKVRICENNERALDRISQRINAFRVRIVSVSVVRTLCLSEEFANSRKNCGTTWEEKIWMEKLCGLDKG